MQEARQRAEGAAVKAYERLTILQRARLHLAGADAINAFSAQAEREALLGELAVALDRVKELEAQVKELEDLLDVTAKGVVIP